MAAHALGARAFDERVGRIALRPHQAVVVPALRHRLLAHGGVLLADATGLGKTYVALAVAQGTRAPLVVAPAALRTMWRESAGRAGLEPPAFLGVEALSRGAGPAEPPGLVIVDEAHHVRTPGTRRHGALRSIAASTPVLLLSATPVHNAVHDLAALCSLFLGDAAYELSLAELQQHVVRRHPRDVPGAVRMPEVRPPERLAVAHDDDRLGQLASIPAPVPPLDGGAAQALCTMSLVRAWCSSDAALAATVRRRLATAHALMAALEAGEHPTRHQLRAWTYADGALQLALPGIVLSPLSLAGTNRGAAAARAQLLDAVRQHAAGLAELLAVQAGGNRNDARRAEQLRLVAKRHPGERVLAFSHSAHTVRALFRELRDLPGLCALTGAGAEIASGRIARDEALARFAAGSRAANAPDADPAGRGPATPDPGAASRLRRGQVTMLLATDLLSEGLNLQHASVVVHLDQPWTAARLEQRVGRLARPGSARERVHVYAIASPASGEALLRVDERLRRKLGVATMAIGAPGTGAPLLPLVESEGAAAEPSEVECRERVRTLLEGFASEARAPVDAPLQHHAPIVAAVAAPCAGWIACLHEPGSPAFLLASMGGGPRTEACAVAAALALATGEDRPPGAASLAAARAQLGAWWRSHAAARLVGAPGLVLSPGQRAGLRRLDAMLGRFRRHERAPFALPAALARSALTRPPSARRDAQLAALAASPDDADWLAAVAALGGRDEPRAVSRGALEPPVVALLLLAVEEAPATA